MLKNYQETHKSLFCCQLAKKIPQSPEVIGWKHELELLWGSLYHHCTPYGAIIMSLERTECSVFME